MEMSFSARPAGSQASECVGEEYPVVVKISPTAAVVSTACNEASNDIESRLAAVSLDAFSVMEAVTDEMAMIQTSLEQLKSKNVTLLEENGTLGQQLIASHSREREMSRVHSLQEEDLSAQIASLQAQLASQAAEREAEVRGLQNLLTMAQREKTDAVVAAQAVWEQQRAQLEQQNNSLQNQIKTSQSQVVSLTNTNSSLQAQINGEPQRQQAALARANANLSAVIDGEIRYCEGQNTPTPIWNGKPYDAKAALAYLKSCLSIYLR